MTNLKLIKVVRKEDTYSSNNINSEFIIYGGKNENQL
jgi:hypothetical protein